MWQGRQDRLPPCALVSPVVKALCLLLLGFLTQDHAAAQEQSWRISDFKDNISIAADGTAQVNEQITLVFVGKWHGIHRKIPIEYPGPEGTNYTLFVKLRNITDDTGNKLKYESSKSGDFRDYKIYIPGAVDATRVVNIAYTVRNGVRY